MNQFFSIVVSRRTAEVDFKNTTGVSVSIENVEDVMSAGFNENRVVIYSQPRMVLLYWQH